MRKYAPFFCNQWQMSVWPEEQAEQKVGCAIKGSIYGSWIKEKNVLLSHKDFGSYNAIFKDF